MKRKITLLLLAAGSLFKMSSQVVLQENFTATFVPASAGWTVQNLSSSIGTTDWFQGVSAVFPAYNGSANDYFAANYQNLSSATGTISTWLITPTLTIYNGAVLEFATRTPNSGTNAPFPDRLQVRMNPSGATSSIVPSGVLSIGTYTNLLLDINPLLSTSTSSAVSNGSVNGYPQAWTVYSVVVSGVTGTVTGNFAFRYFVDNTSGNNSDYIGIDAVKYTLPCGPTVQSYTTCAGASTTLQAIGIPATTYSWNTGAVTSSIVVSPASTTVYTLFPSNGATSCGTSVTATITVGAQLGVTAMANPSVICAGQTVTLSSIASATSYTWGIGTTPIAGGNAPTVTVAPTTNTTYSLAVQNGNTCFGLTSAQVSVMPLPSVSITASSGSVLCVSGPSVPVTFTGSGAVNYIWVSGASTATGTSVNFNIAAQSNTTPAVQQATLGLIGQSGNGCAAAVIYTLVIEKTPTISVTSTTNSACTNTTVNITASATNSSNAVSYSWSGAGTGTNNPLALATGSAAGVKTVTVLATAANGCTATASFNQTVVVCNTSTGTTVGLTNISGSAETAIFPNPFVNEIKINTLYGHVVIFNAIGQAVISVPVRSSEVINTENLPKGAYLLKAYNENGETVKTAKLIKN